MKHEDWCIHSSTILAEADKYNEWRIKAKYRLLADFAPRIAKLSTQGYRGCGFHYSMEQRFAKLVEELSLPWQPSGNHCVKIEDEQIKAMWAQVTFKGLLQEIRTAENLL